MQEDARYIKAWLRLSERIIKTNRLESKKNRKEKALMEQYFKWHPPTQGPKKRRKLSHQKQDLKPD
jgi:recombinational DNA repair protein (RecF pathway)